MEELFDLISKVESLKPKVIGNENLTLDEACLLIWAEFDVGLNSKEMFRFKNYFLSQKIENANNWQTWKNIFLQFEKIDKK